MTPRSPTGQQTGKTLTVPAETEPSAEIEPNVAAWVKTDETGPLRPVLSGELPARLAGGTWVWVDVTAATTEIALDFGRRFRLPDHVMADTVSPSVFPKWEDHDDRLLMVIHLPTSDDDHVDTTPLVCIIGPDLLLTFHDRPHPGLDWLLDAAARHAVLAEGGPDVMLGRLAELAAREFHPLVEGCGVAFDALVDRALQGDSGVLSDTEALRRDAAVLRTVLGPQREAFLSLAAVDTNLLGTDARRRLRDAYDHHQQLVGELDAARMMLASVADTYRAAVAERTNEVMKVLTVFSAILLPLTVIVGIYGMNFERMPELTRPWGYPVVLATMAVIAIGLWTYFVRRGFIGRPRATRAPRRVGRGVLAAARSPARTVSALVLRSGERPAPSGLDRSAADLDRETIEVVADLFRLGW
ncbi:MAG: magnesium transporter CorA family protein, partial [Actinomycetota bacterium]|nr:magnesium transporter CorA family protein [Actinomycetota bacterium]